MVKGKNGPGPFTSEDDEEPPLPTPQPLIPTLPLTPALGFEEPPIGVVIDEESPQFRAALDRRIAELQLLRDESPIIDNPLGLIDIAPRVDLPLGNQSSSRSTKIRAIPLNLRPSSPIPSDDDTSISSSKISSRFVIVSLFHSFHYISCLHVRTYIAYAAHRHKVFVPVLGFSNTSTRNSRS